jgi:hypothetical protein
VCVYYNLIQHNTTGKREDGLRKELQDALDKEHHRLEEKMKLDHEIQLLHHSVATLRSQLDGLYVYICVFI